MRLRLPALIAASVWLQLAAAQPPARIVTLSFSEIEPVLAYLPHLLPDDLKNRDNVALQALWPEWSRRKDAEIRGRLAAGDEDSLVNLLLFGTSFTTQPRVTVRRAFDAASTAGGSTDDLAAARTVRARIDDFVFGMRRPRGNERLLFAQQVFAALGYSTETDDGRRSIRGHLSRAVARAIAETQHYARTIEESEQVSATAQFALRSKLYEGRGLSSDTSLRPNFAIEEALRAINSKGLLPARIAKVAVVGPGLDFADKEDGHDFYPQQTLQPFGVADSLLRLHASADEAVELTTFDLSPRVNAHLAMVRSRSLAGEPTRLHFVMPVGGGWNRDYVEYAERLGDRIGMKATPVASPRAAGSLKVRAVNVRPAFGRNLTAADVNIVLQRMDLRDDEKFDLVVGTNVFLYYEEFQQALAMLNIERMLKPGGLLLVNNALVELPSSRLRSVGTTTVTYSAAKEDGDVIIWYRLRE